MSDRGSRRGALGAVLLLGLVVFVIPLSVGAGVALDRYVLSAFLGPSQAPAGAGPQFQLIGQAWTLVDRFYVDRSAVVPERLAHGAIRGMVDALGDTGHSTFLTADMVRQEKSLSQGKFEGIGAYVQMKDGHVIIAAAMDGSPAQQAGLKSGDIILKVDGQSVAGQSVGEVVSQVTGPPGTTVTLTIMDPATQATRDVTLTRASIELHNVVWHILPGTHLAHVRISTFSQGVSDDLTAALGDIQQQQVSGIILDLRDDPGGLLNEAIDVTSHFLSSGTVLLEQDAQGQTTAIPVNSNIPTTSAPLVVLTDKGTASAAEIVTGALQDAGRATVIGETTFGTGTVLREFPLSDGSAVMLAVREWLTPNGRVIWHQGLAPDVVVPLPTDASPLFPSGEGTLTAQQLANSQDTQLHRAIAELSAAGESARARAVDP